MSLSLLLGSKPKAMGEQWPQQSRLLESNRDDNAIDKYLYDMYKMSMSKVDINKLLGRRNQSGLQEERKTL